jgi:hypothetical protein
VLFCIRTWGSSPKWRRPGEAAGADGAPGAALKVPPSLSCRANLWLPPHGRTGFFGETKKPLLRSRHFPCLHESETLSSAGPERSEGQAAGLLTGLERRARLVVGPGVFFLASVSEPKGMKFSPQGWHYGRVAPGRFCGYPQGESLLFFLF